MRISARARELYDDLGRGWNTWDLQSVTAHVFLPDRVRLNIGFFVPHINHCVSNTLWDNAENFGEHTLDGSYTELFVRFEGALCRIETAAQGEELLIRLTPVEKRHNLYAMLEVGSIQTKQVAVAYEADGIVARSAERSFTIRALQDSGAPVWNPSNAINLTAKLDATAYFKVNSDKTAARIDQTLAANREAWLKTSVSADGALGRGLVAMKRSLLWNTVYDFVNGRVIAPVSRNWCKRNSSFGDYVLFGWDTFFAGLQFGLIDKRAAYAAIFSILEEETPEGMIPNFGCGTGLSRDRSEPQVGALCAWKLYIQFGDKWFIEECFDRLLAWNRWRFRERDFNKDGLLELASTPWELAPTDEIWSNICVGEKQGAMWESGIDNSPMWDRAVHNEEHHCLELSYVGLNSLMVADCEILAKMADLLAKTAEKEELLARAKTLAEKIETNLWDEASGYYLNRHWSGEFDSCKSMTHFYTLTAGVAKGERLARLLEHMRNEEEFGGTYVIPNVSRDDPAFEDQAYWRGRIWAPTNFLVGEGLLRVKEYEIYDEITRKGLDLFVKCWDEKGYVGENYNAITGEAAEKGASSDKFYHWGALLVYMAVSRLLNFNEWEDRTEAREVPDWLGEIRNIPGREETRG